MTNHEVEPLPTIGELIDRMVDGGMLPDELRKCVERLDAAPESWRRCALAFLEAQSWTDAFRSIDGGASAISADLPLQSLAALNPPPVKFAGAPPRRLVVAALAAGIASLAFSLGWLSHGVRLRSDVNRAGDDAVAVTVASKTPGPQPDKVARLAALSEPLQPGSIAGLPADRLPTVREVARLRIGNGGAGSAEIPVFAGPGVSQRWLLEQPPPVSEHDRVLWQRQGYQLEQRRRLLSVPLADGRRATVPVDHVQVRYVGQVPL